MIAQTPRAKTSFAPTEKRSHASENRGKPWRLQVVSGAWCQSSLFMIMPAMRQGQRAVGGEGELAKNPALRPDD